MRNTRSLLESLESRVLLSTTNPVIFNITDSAGPGQVLGIQGDNFGTDAEVWIDRITGSSDMPNLETNLTGSILSRSSQFIAVEVPVTFQEGLWAVYVRDPDNGAVSTFKFVNQASVMQALDLASTNVSSNFAFRLYGRNLDFASTATTVRFYDATLDNGTSLTAGVTQGSDPYILNVTAPANLVVGHKYDIYVSNGYGGNYGEIKGPQVTAIAGGTDYWGIGTPWAGSKFSFYGNVYNVQTDARLALRAVGDGVTNDQPAIQAAINAASAAGGGVVYLPGTAGGYYLAGNALGARNNVVLKGDGMDATRIWDDAGGGTGAVVTGNGNAFGAIDLTVESVGANGFYNAWATNTGAHGDTNLVILRTRLKSAHGGVFIYGANASIVKDSELIGTSSNGNPIINATGRVDLSFKNNRMIWQDGRMQLQDMLRFQFEGNWASRSINTDHANVGYGGPSLGGSEWVALINNIFDKLEPTADPATSADKIPTNNDGETIMNENIQYNGLGDVSSAGESTMTDATRNWSNNSRKGWSVTIINGPGMGQTRQIVGNSSNTLSLDQPWDVLPTSASNYAITKFDSNYLIKGNQLTEVPRGIWATYAGSMDNVVIADNLLTDTNGIYLRGDERPDSGPKRFNVQKNVLVENNTVWDRRGWYPAQIVVTNGNADEGTPHYGNSFYDVVVRKNSLTGNALYGTRTDDGSGVGEGYYAQSMGLVIDDNQPFVMGVVFDSNTAKDIATAYHVNGGSYQTVIWNSSQDNVGQVVGDGPESYTIQVGNTITTYTGTHPSVGTVLGWTAAATTPPYVTISAIDSSAAEAGQDVGKFRFTRSGTSGALVVNYTIDASSSASTGDYAETLSGSITIPNGQSFADLVITPVDDTTYFEANETLTLALTTSPNYRIGQPKATITITENDITSKILDVSFDGSGGGTGGASDIVRVGGTGSLVQGTSPDLISIDPSNPLGGTGGNSAHVVFDGGGSTPYALITPASAANSWAALSTKDASGIWHVDGAFDFFVRRNSSGGSLRFIDTAGGGWNIILSFNSGSALLRIDAPGANDLSIATTALTANQAFHIGFTFVTDAAGVVTVKAFQKQGTDAIDTTSAANLVNTVTWNPDDTATGKFPSGAFKWGVNPAYASYAGNYDLDTLRLYNQAPGNFGPIAADTTVTVTGANGSETGPAAGTFTFTRNTTVGATTVYYTLGGTATLTDDYTVSGTLGSVTIPDGSSSAIVTITPQDDAWYEGTETVTISPVSNPAYVVGTASASLNIADNDASATTVTVAATDNTATENPTTTGTFTITRTNTAGNLTVRYTVDGTATAGSDYTALTGTATILSGSLSTTVTVTPLNDNEIESATPETIVLKLDTGTGYAIGASSSATVNLTSEDVPSVSLVVDDASAAEANSNLAKFTLTRAGLGAALTESNLVVNITPSGTATNGSDYDLPATITIPSGQESVSLYLAPIIDSNVEAAETATFTVASGTGYTVGSPASGQASIAADVPNVTLTVVDGAGAELGSDPVVFRVTRVGTGLVNVGDVTVHYNVSGNTTSGQDYALLSGTVVIPNGQSSADIVINPIDDFILEDAEEIHLTLQEDPGYIVDSFINTAEAAIADHEAWTNQDIGGPKAGSWEYDADTGVYTVKGSGAGLGATASPGRDEFNFLWQPWTGDGEIIVHVDSNQNDLSGWNRAGVMVRESLNEDSRFAFIGMLAGGNGAMFQRRLTTGGTTGENHTTGYNAPRWLRLVRTTNPSTGVVTFNAYQQSDSVHDTTGVWTAVGSAVNFAAGTMSGSIYVGLAVTSRDSTAYNTATFSRLALNYAQDNFETNTTSGGNGWANNWTFAGTAGIVSTGVPNAGTYHLQLTGNTGVATRTVDLSDMFPGNTQLELAYKASDFEAGETATVEVYDGSWRTLLTVGDGRDDDLYHTVKIGLAGLTASSNFQIRIKSNMSDAADNFYVDDLKIVGTDATLPMVSITANDAAASETGPDGGSFTVSRLGTTGDLTVGYTLAGTATNGADYAALTGTVTIPDGSSSAIITVTPANDGTVEGAETVIASLAFGNGYQVGAQAAATVTIADNDVTWTDQDIGSTGAAGSYSYNSGTYTINGAGADIYGTSDKFNYLWQNWTGDGEIVVRVATIQNTNAWAKAGIMIRQSLAANSAYAMVDLTPTTTNGVEFNRRATTGGSSAYTKVTGVAPAYWVKLVRAGDAFSAYRSPDGVTWTQVGTAATIVMTGSVYAGLIVSSHVTGTLCTATFDNLNIKYAQDNFESGNATGGTGWAGGWSLGGSASVVTTGTPHAGTYHMLLTDSTAVATRSVDLSDAPKARLQFWYKAVGFSGGDNATIEIFDGVWHTVQTITTADGAYHLADIDLSSFSLSSNFQIRIKANMDSTSDQFYIDDLLIVQPG